MGAVINAVADTAWENASTTWGQQLLTRSPTGVKNSLTAYTMNYTSSALIGLPGTMNVLSNAQTAAIEFFGDIHCSHLHWYNRS